MMRSFYLKLAIAAPVFFTACTPSQPAAENKLKGSWKLVSSVYIKNDTVMHNDLPGTSMMKILNDTHFAFLQHTVDKADTTGVFAGGGGTYTSARRSLHRDPGVVAAHATHEGNAFEFTIAFHGDTLIQEGVENLKELGAGEENLHLVEKYLRIK